MLNGGGKYSNCFSRLFFDHLLMAYLHDTILAEIVMLLYAIVWMRCNSCLWFDCKCCKISFALLSFKRIHQDDKGMSECLPPILQPVYIRQFSSWFLGVQTKNKQFNYKRKRFGHANTRTTNIFFLLYIRNCVCLSLIFLGQVGVLFKHK